MRLVFSMLIGFLCLLLLRFTGSSWNFSEWSFPPAFNRALPRPQSPLSSSPQICWLKVLLDFLSLLRLSFFLQSFHYSLFFFQLNFKLCRSRDHVLYFLNAISPTVPGYSSGHMVGCKLSKFYLMVPRPSFLLDRKIRKICQVFYSFQNMINKTLRKTLLPLCFKTSLLTWFWD